MAEQFWRIRRWRERESRVMDYDDGETGLIALTKMMPVVQRLMSAAERGFHKALSALRQLQKDRGFVPQKDTSQQTERPVQDGDLIPDRMEVAALGSFHKPVRKLIQQANRTAVI